MKRKSLIFGILLSLVLLVAVVPFAQAATLSVLINGTPLTGDVAPFIQNGRVLVPMRAIFEALGANVTWDASSQTVTATEGDTSVSLVIGQTMATVGEEQENLDVPAMIVGGSTVVPLRFVSEAMGAQVSWDPGQNQVVINSAATNTGGALPATLSGNLIEDGSTSVQPLAQELATAFMAKYPGVNVTIAGGGSGVGIADAEAGKVNIGASSSALAAKDAKILTGTTICKDAIVIVVNPNNPISKLTSKQVGAIFSGVSNDWGAVGGFRGQPIMVYTREVGSGTLTFFNQQFMGKSAMVPTAQTLTSNDLIRQAVASNQNAIGFLSMGYVDSTIKALPLDGVDPTLANAKSGLYPYVRPFILATKGDPTGLAKDFIEYALSPDGQKIAAKDYLPL
jgi:phosphate transport system substrate-binding protein